MGMFDDFECVTELLPDLPYDLGEVFAAQTKDLDCMMDRYRIMADGTLAKYWSTWEDTDEVDEQTTGFWQRMNERANERRREAGEPEHEPPPVYYKRVKVAEGWTPVTDLHQDICFYTTLRIEDEASLWLEFKARFTEGQLSRIETVKVEERPLPQVDDLGHEYREVDLGGENPLKIVSLSGEKRITRR